MVGVHVASHWISTRDIWVCTVLIKYVNSPTCVTRNTSHKATNFSYLWCTPGHHLIIPYQHIEGLIWLDSKSIVSEQIVSCLLVYKCTAVPVVPDFRVACILSSSLNCKLLNLRFLQWILWHSFSANCERNVMDIWKCLGKRTQKEQSDKSSGEESDIEESLCHADKSKTFMTCPFSNKWSAQQKKKCYKEKLSYKKVWEEVYPWVQGSVWRS